MTSIPLRSVPDRRSVTERKPCSARFEPLPPRARRPRCTAAAPGRGRARGRSLSHRRYQPLPRSGRCARLARSSGRRRRGLPLARADPPTGRCVPGAATAACPPRRGDLTVFAPTRPPRSSSALSSSAGTRVSRAPGTCAAVGSVASRRGVRSSCDRRRVASSASSGRGRVAGGVSWPLRWRISAESSVSASGERCARMALGQARGGHRRPRRRGSFATRPPGPAPGSRAPWRSPDPLDRRVDARADLIAALLSSLAEILQCLIEEVGSGPRRRRRRLVRSRRAGGRGRRLARCRGRRHDPSFGRRRFECWGSGGTLESSDGAEPSIRSMRAGSIAPCSVALFR